MTLRAVGGKVSPSDAVGVTVYGAAARGEGRAQLLPQSQMGSR
jgi:hypothetical protein